MDDNFSYNCTNQLCKGEMPIVFNMWSCSDRTLLSNSNLLFAKTPKWKETGLLKKPRLLRRCAALKEIDGFCSGRIEIATVAALLRNDMSGLFFFLCILRIRSGARNDKKRISVSLQVIRRIARQSQPSLWDFLNRPFRGNDSVAQELIPIGVREYYECQIF